MEYSKKKLYSTQSDYTREDGTVLQQLKKAAQYTIWLYKGRRNRTPAARESCTVHNLTIQGKTGPYSNS